MSRTSKLDFTRTASIVLSWPHMDRDMLRKLMDEKDKTQDRPVKPKKVRNIPHGDEGP